MNQIAVLGSHLRDDIRSVVSEFTAGQLVAKVIACVDAQLQRLGAEGKRFPDESSFLTATAHLDSFANHYTMKVERDVHQSIAGGPPFTGPAPMGDPAITIDDGNLGDNVELF